MSQPPNAPTWPCYRRGSPAGQYRRPGCENPLGEQSIIWPPGACTVRMPKTKPLPVPLPDGVRQFPLHLDRSWSSMLHRHKPDSWATTCLLSVEGFHYSCTHPRGMLCAPVESPPQRIAIIPGQLAMYER